jgi:hypothetical protein
MTPVKIKKKRGVISDVKPECTRGTRNKAAPLSKCVSSSSALLRQPTRQDSNAIAKRERKHT